MNSKNKDVVGRDVTSDFQLFAEAYIEDLRRTLSEMPIEELEKLHERWLVQSGMTLQYTSSEMEAVLQHPLTVREIGQRNYA